MHYDLYNVHFQLWKMTSDTEVWGAFLWFVDLSEEDYNMLTNNYYGEVSGYFWDSGVIKDVKSDCVGSPTIMGMLNCGHKAEDLFGCLLHSRRYYEDVLEVTVNDYTEYLIVVEKFHAGLEDDSSLRSQGTFAELEVMEEKLQMKMKDIAATMEQLIV